MHIENMTLEQVTNRLDEIRSLVANNDPNADFVALEQEVRQLLQRKADLEADSRSAEEKRQGLANMIALGEAGTPIPGNGGIPKTGSRPAARQYNAASPEYRTAFSLHLMGRDDQMTQEQRAAFVATTANTAAVMPTTMLNEIWDLVSKEHSILSDITIYRTGTILEVVKHTAITQGAAAAVNENAANDDESNTFVKVTLTGQDFSKTVNISYALGLMSVPAFEQYLIREIATGLSGAMADHVVAKIKAGMASGNKMTTGTVGAISYKEVATAFGKLLRAGAISVYGRRNTIYNYLVGMVDSTGRPVFQPNAQVGAEGSILGGAIKIEDSVADGELLIGDPKKVLMNMVQDVMLEKDKNIDKHVIIHSGYARGEAVLIDDSAFVALTVKTA